MKRATFTVARIVMGWIDSKELTDLDFNHISFNPWGVSLGIERVKLTDEQYRVLKRLFGPMTAQDQWQAKGQSGNVVITDGVEIKLTIDRVYTCEELDPQDLSEERWDEIKELAKTGMIKLQDCKQVEGVTQ